MPTSSGLLTRLGLATSPGLAARRTESVPAHLVVFDVMVLGADSLSEWLYTGERRH
ncbi:hypothetical protein GCM10011583_73760 [Streptomyces camponoticapitis]|uniref:Uncharacterized protein n=1 Tax=Streptomyces camponoticapitis TaxID=1616125 RepID=A0ABQ2EYU0_9ACTN|nr:hypothetical protein [Streptomyces camponoticapitis]GGK31163.1 hypothetical protein GCM10011583_73760 [Streptomyces camponoticapitis]